MRFYVFLLVSVYNFYQKHVRLWYWNFVSVNKTSVINEESICDRQLCSRIRAATNERNGIIPVVRPNNLSNHTGRVTSETRSSHLVTRLASPEILHVTVPLLLTILLGPVGSKRENDRNTSEWVKWERWARGDAGRFEGRPQEHNVRQADNGVGPFSAGGLEIPGRGIYIDTNRYACTHRIARSRIRIFDAGLD